MAAAIGILGVAGGVAACGTAVGAARRDPARGHGRRGGGDGLRVELMRASFPPRQRLAQQTKLEIAVRNSGTRPIPDIAVTLVNPRYGTAAQPLGTLIAASPPGGPILAGRSRPVWVIDRAPGACAYSCRQGGLGAAATADANTWALGRLARGATATFTWHVTAVRPGGYKVGFVVASALTGPGAQLVGPGGRPLRGSFAVTISSRAPTPHVTGSGQVVYSG